MNIAHVRKKSKELFERYERHLSSAGLIIGFVADSLTFQRVDLWFGTLVLFFYMAVAVSGIFIINIYEDRALRGKFLEFLYYWAPIAVQYALGGLFSGFVIFYSSSSSFGASWPFLVLLVGILIGNEFFKKRYLHLAFPVSLFFLAIFSFFIFYVPILLGTMGAWVFLASGVASLASIGLFVYALSLAVPGRVRQSKDMLIRGIGGIYVAVTVLYFLNIIPPIPLSLRDAGVYHSVSRAEGGYVVTYEPKAWYERFRKYESIRLASGEPVYIYSAVFAPTKLNTEVVHHWQYYDAKTRKWASLSKSRFPIIGGRDGGYRGYSWKSNISPGFWRVDIETSRGQRIGRVAFKAEMVSGPVPIETDIK